MFQEIGWACHFYSRAAEDFTFCVYCSVFASLRERRPSSLQYLADIFVSSEALKSAIKKKKKKRKHKECYVYLRHPAYLCTQERHREGWCGIFISPHCGMICSGELRVYFGGLECFPFIFFFQNQAVTSWTQRVPCDTGLSTLDILSLGAGPPHGTTLVNSKYPIF